MSKTDKVSRLPRLLVDFAGAALGGYFAHKHAQAFEPGWVAFFAFQAGGLFVDGVANAIKIAYGDTHYTPVFDRFKQEKFDPEVLDDFLTDTDQKQGRDETPTPT